MPDSRKDTYIHSRIAVEDKEHLQEVARSLGLSLTSLLVSTALQKYPKDKAPE